MKGLTNVVRFLQPRANRVDLLLHRATEVVTLVQRGFDLVFFTAVDPFLEGMVAVRALSGLAIADVLEAILQFPDPRLTFHHVVLMISQFTLLGHVQLTVKVRIVLHIDFMQQSHHFIDGRKAVVVRWKTMRLDTETEFSDQLLTTVT
ncbi:hypothetical protein D3C76_529860 [compost metagenome]